MALGGGQVACYGWRMSDDLPTSPPLATAIEPEIRDAVRVLHNAVAAGNHDVEQQARLMIAAFERVRLRQAAFIQSRIVCGHCGQVVKLR